LICLTTCCTGFQTITSYSSQSTLIRTNNPKNQTRHLSCSSPPNDPIIRPLSLHPIRALHSFQATPFSYSLLNNPSFYLSSALNSLPHSFFPLNQLFLSLIDLSSPPFTPKNMSPAGIFRAAAALARVTPSRAIYVSRSSISSPMVRTNRNLVNTSCLSKRAFGSTVGRWAEHKEETFEEFNSR
jgi:hypothetical protein